MGLLTIVGPPPGVPTHGEPHNDNQVITAHGLRLVDWESLALAPPGPYALEAAIAAVHAEAKRAEGTDWRQIALLYDRLQALHPSPVVALNRAVAISMASGPGNALPLVDELAESLGAYHLWHSTRAELLRRLGRRDESRAAYRKALELAQNEAERRYLARRLDEL